QEFGSVLNIAQRGPNVGAEERSIEVHYYELTKIIDIYNILQILDFMDAIFTFKNTHIPNLNTHIKNITTETTGPSRMALKQLLWLTLLAVQKKISPF
ncbi:hypothetical protein ACJX0J_017502, partial [Zea mays]